MALSGANFALSFLVWEAVFWLAWVLLHSPGARRSLTPAVQRDGAAYVVSAAHALFASARGVRHILRLWAAPPMFKLCIPPDAYLTDAAAPFVAEAHTVVTTNISLAGYLASDLVHVLLWYPRLGRMDTVLHHMAFLACALFAGRGNLFPFMFGWLIVGEASTPFLNIRWFAIKNGLGHTRFMKHISLAFAGTFFITRFWIYGAGMIHLWKIYEFLPDESRGVASATVASFMAFGFVLNMIWLSKIGRVALAPTRPKDERQSSAVPEATETADAAPKLEDTARAVWEPGSADASSKEKVS